MGGPNPSLNVGMHSTTAYATRCVSTALKIDGALTSRDAFGNKRPRSRGRDQWGRLDSWRSSSSLASGNTIRSVPTAASRASRTVRTSKARDPNALSKRPGSVHQTVPALQMNIIVDSVCETQGRSWCHGTMHSSPRFESSVPEEMSTAQQGPPDTIQELRIALKGTQKGWVQKGSVQRRTSARGPQGSCAQPKGSSTMSSYRAVSHSAHSGVSSRPAAARSVRSHSAAEQRVGATNQNSQPLRRGERHVHKQALPPDVEDLGQASWHQRLKNNQTHHFKRKPYPLPSHSKPDYAYGHPRLVQGGGSALINPSTEGPDPNVVLEPAPEQYPVYMGKAIPKWKSDFPTVPEAMTDAARSYVERGSRSIAQEPMKSKHVLDYGW